MQSTIIFSGLTYVLLPLAIAFPVLALLYYLKKN